MRKSRLFFIGRREVFIEAVATAILTYTMRIFKIPIGLVSNIQNLITQFWWGWGWQELQDTLVELEEALEND